MSVDVYDGNIEAVLSSGGNIYSNGGTGGHHGSSSAPYDRYYDGYSRSNSQTSYSSSVYNGGGNEGEGGNGRSVIEQISGFWEENILRPLYLSSYFYGNDNSTSNRASSSERYKGGEYMPPGEDGIYSIVSGAEREDVERGDYSALLFNVVIITLLLSL